MAQSLQKMLPLLRCPRSLTKLEFKTEMLVSEVGEEYPVVNGKPVLVRQISDLHINPPPKEITSQNIPVYYAPDSLSDSNALILHLGSGNVASPDPRVISLDVVPCENVDIVGEAEYLPFLDQVFDYVESGAVFEHVYDPIKAIKEIRRVLKPGGRFRIDTAFLQGYHGYPGHYYNMTPQAVETFLVDDFDLELSTVPDSATPAHTVLDLLQRFLFFVPEADREAQLNQPLRNLIEKLKADESRKNPLLVGFDEFPLRALGASYVVIARKPEDYEKKVIERMSEGEAKIDAWQSLKREYYSARMGLIYRHHEANFFIRLSKELGYVNVNVEKPGNLDDLLKECEPTSLLDPEAVRSAIKALRIQEEKMILYRDQWIQVYSGKVVQPQAANPQNEAQNKAQNQSIKAEEEIKQVVVQPTLQKRIMRRLGRLLIKVNNRIIRQLGL